MSEATVQEAVKILRDGGVVAFPTETVYGLGADATDGAAVRKVFAVKGRPATNPVIVHVTGPEMARRYAAKWPDAAEKLVKVFWPGPLTIIVPKTDAIATAATAGRKSVGLRAPDHPLAMQLIGEFDNPLIGPSANRSQRVSPTTAQHVRDELGARVDMVLDGGPCRIGIESTVLDLSGAAPIILRPGAISRYQIEQVIGSVETHGGVVASGKAAPSPGMQGVHYAPITPTYRFERRHVDRVAAWCMKNPSKPAIIVRLGSVGGDDPMALAMAMNQRQLIMPNQPVEYARNMYATLRHADRQSPSVIWVEMPPDDAQWLAVRDRLMRATRVFAD